MSNPLHAPFFADRASWIETTVMENIRLARDTYRVRFACPEIARQITPGQFVMLRCAGVDDPLLGRPLALYDTVLSSGGEPLGLDIVYLVTGKFTRRVANSPAGQSLEVWGPLGNGFPPQTVEHLIMVAGGIGQTPFLALAAEHRGHKRYGQPKRGVPHPKKITFCYGARRADYFAGLDDFRRLGIDIRLSTDDGSAGHHGFVTDVLRELLAEPDGSTAPSRQIVCCGPEPMMAAVAKIAQDYQTPCQVSLETPMTCGIGICFTCVAKVSQSDGGWDYKRTCVEGPIFAAEQIVW
ncbi:MAG TPA: dihydroorotate dehydrogenase electron transfer subunit [Pirellulales bacterium]|jgi:dihydroorotate dehydrogenase electron transfer subunit|nr:dihydroorotate dehydrogenase electron transfer subunit [Pirellulales bacterium]